MVAITSVIYLAYKLYSYNYPENFWQLLAQSFSANAHYFWFCILLLPFNLSAETLKWKTLTNKTEKIKFSAALQSVLAGFSTGFISPNRTAEFVGRAIYFEPRNRASIITLSICNGIIQNLVIGAIGLLAIILASKKLPTYISFNSSYLILASTVLIVLGIAMLFTLPKIAKKASSKSLLKSFFNGLSMLSQTQIMLAIGYSCIRYLIFCIQFFLMLQFLAINISFNEALWAIPAYYFLVSFTPTIAFGELTVRSAYAIIVLSSLAPHNAALLAFAGFAMWLINFATPMILFYLIQLQKNVFGKQNLKQ